MYSANPTLGYYVPPLDVNNLTDQQTAISIEHLSLYYQQSRALSDISMRIPKGQVTAFIGPSGCGKSTLLRCINRMNDLVEGTRVEGEVKLHGKTSIIRMWMCQRCVAESGWCFSARIPFLNRFMKTWCMDCVCRGLK